MVLALQEIVRKALDKGTIYLKKIMETALIGVCEDAKENRRDTYGRLRAGLGGGGRGVRNICLMK